MKSKKFNSNFFTNFAQAANSIVVEELTIEHIEISAPETPLECTLAAPVVVAEQETTQTQCAHVSVPANGKGKTKGKRKTTAQIIEESEPLECAAFNVGEQLTISDL